MEELLINLKTMNKGIPTPLAFIIILVLAAIVAGGMWWYQRTSQEETSVALADKPLSMSKESCTIDHLSKDSHSEHVMVADAFWNEEQNSCFYITRGVYAAAEDWAIEYAEANDVFIYVVIYQLMDASKTGQDSSVLYEAYRHKSLEEYLEHPDERKAWKEDFYEKVNNFMQGG